MPLSKIKTRMPLAILLLLVASLTMVFITEDSNRRATNLMQRLGDIATNRLHLYDLIKGVLDAESGQRGYLLSGREEYLAPYSVALKNIEVAFAQLDAAYSSEPASKVLLTKLHALTATKLSELAITVQMLKDGKYQTGKDFTLSGIGQEYMEAIRATGAELLAVETQRLQTSQREVSDILVYSRVGVALLTALSLFLVLLNMRENLAFKAVQEKHRVAMQAEQENLQSEVMRRTAKLLEVNNHLQTVREDERHRIARDLHDELGALLTAAKLDVARIKSRLGTTAPEALERINHLATTLNAGIAMKRRIIEDLWPSSLANLGLVASLKILAGEFSKTAGIPVHCALQPVQLTPNAQLVVYRLVQEATTNIAKYAKADNVWLELAALNGRVEMTVRDDGAGFDTRQIASKAHGLLGMRFRVEAELGSLELISKPGEGTLVRAQLPESLSLPQSG
ncbi:CHASE3 domain-containing protein [Candidatus Aalborgicola defluviihabitans]|uniref:CHASE3 domain-containing protein n=1 Tax=Candidatus Aalborgicola defluviihabitans TaxID=3386187 RepID=UPI001D835A2D|nr:CHASE3 domain-containing protein [Burkholderiales bacterium]